MADDGQIIRGIDWRQTFPFVHIFRSFRVAIHPSKLVLGLALLFTIYFGGCILDSIWPIGDRAIPGIASLDVTNEVIQYEQIATGKEGGTIYGWREDKKRVIDAAYKHELQETVDGPRANENPPDAEKRADADARARNRVDEVLAYYSAQLATNRQNVEDQWKKADDEFNKSPKGSDDRARHDEARRLHDTSLAKLYDDAAGTYNTIKSYRGAGIFETFFGYETNQISGVVEAVRDGAWLSQTTIDGVLVASVVHRIFNFLTVGPVWMIWVHPVFAILFGLLFLFAWSLFGGAISRIAAVHVARDEKISIRQAMNFAVGKFLSFASAPVIPILIVVVIGLVVALAALLGNIPYLGPIIIGVCFFLALLAGFMMTLVLLGTVGGFNLMYPTIAVEGSDSFDAISRSFSYVYARPWRMLFYTAVAVIYGAATYLFVHMFILLMLVLTHHFVDMGIFTHAYNTRNLLSVMWPNPESTGRLAYHVDWLPLNGWQGLGAFLIRSWVFLLISFLGAFAISLYFSANSIIYYLMRNEVDATEMDDVYLEQSEEEFGETARVTVAGAVVTGESGTPGGSPVAPADPSTGGDPNGAPPASQPT